MALLFSSVPCDNKTSTIGQAFSQKMAAGCDDFWVMIFGIFSQMCHPSLHNNGK